MDFREATDLLCERVDHEDVAKALGVSLQAVRQARLSDVVKAHREPPKDWPYAVIRLAEKQILRSRRLIDQVRREVPGAR